MHWRDTCYLIAPVPSTAPRMTHLLGLQASFSGPLACVAAAYFPSADSFICTPFIKDFSSVVLQEDCDAPLVVSHAFDSILCNVCMHGGQAAFFVVSIALVAVYGLYVSF